MQVVHDDIHRRHHPSAFLVNGTPQPSPEVPERAERLSAALREEGHSFRARQRHGLGPIAAIHTPEYLDFLTHIHTRWQRIEGASAEVVPNVHPQGRWRVGYPASAVGQAGYHMADTACPVGEGTWTAAVASAEVALTAADLLADGAGAAYALCRPPGHHAYPDMAGGFCFLNNTAIAAQHLLTRGLRPAILDVDVHHGNGTQAVFDHRADVLTVSLHADPARFYPFFWGHADERGLGEGTGYNLNIPLARGTGDDAYLRALEGRAASRIEAFAPDVLVVALGLDAHEGDPLQGLALTTGGLGRVGAAIAALGLPTLLVQEGGYLQPALADNLVRFMRGFEGRQPASA